MWSLFIDDERFPPNDGREWIIARNYSQVMDLIQRNGAPNYISFDHDLGENEPSGYEIAQAIIALELDGQLNLPPLFDYYIHSQNPVGRDNIRALFHSYRKFRGLHT